MNIANNSLKKRIHYMFGFANRTQIQNILLNTYEGTLQKAKPKSYPITVQIEVTNNCNIDCVICFRKIKSTTFRNISPDLLPEIIKISQNVRDFELFGYGEPLLADIFIDLLNQTKSARCSFTTNGLLLTEKMIEKIMTKCHKPIHHISFSIDSINAQSYESIRSKSNFNAVMHNMNNLSAYKNKFNLRWPEIWINFVAMKRNIEELPQLLEIATILRASRINVCHLVVWDKELQSESLINETYLTKEIFNELPRRKQRGIFNGNERPKGRGIKPRLRNKALKKAEEIGIILDLPVAITKNGADSIPSSLPKCNLPWQYTYIRQDGSVLPCYWCSDNLVMGNLNNNKFEKIWNDKPYQMLRETINITPYSDCRRCEMRFRYTVSPDDYQIYMKF